MTGARGTSSPRSVGGARTRAQGARERRSPRPEHRAVALLHLGRASEAVALLAGIERTHPGSYVTAANLGTAYELAGNNEVALKWIRQAIRRRYQLEERYQFVGPPDPVVANILFDWGNLLFRTDALESAIAVYREALRFGVPQTALAQARLARAQEALRQHARRKR